METLQDRIMRLPHEGLDAMHSSTLPFTLEKSTVPEDGLNKQGIEMGGLKKIIMKLRHVQHIARLFLLCLYKQEFLVLVRKRDYKVNTLNYNISSASHKHAYSFHSCLGLQ